LPTWGSIRGVCRLTTVLVIDANIMVSALIGRSLPLLADQAARGIVLAAPLPQLAETRMVLGRHGTLDAAERMDALLAIVEPLDPIAFEGFEERARERLEAHGQPDWPVLAAAMALGGQIWSHDKDFLGVGVPVWSNRNVRHLEPEAR
jgi:predicted nucleic acid-binding protein